MNGDGESSQQLKLEDSKEGNIATAAASALAAAAVKAKVCHCCLHLINPMCYPYNHSRYF